MVFIRHFLVTGLILLAGTGLVTAQATADPPVVLAISPYSQPIGEDGPEIEMVALPGGSFRMGQSADTPHARPDEGPPVEVEVSAFWIGRYEITWEQYEQFVYSDAFQEVESPFEGADVNVVTRPSRTYIDPSFGMGRGDHPAVSMTQHAALAFTRWLSLKTGLFYRLPTEAEWEYACRIQSDGGFYHFGDDVDDLDSYAWYYDNSDDRYHPVGGKKPNYFGVYDLHGNVAEWTLDQYVEDYHERLTEGTARDPWIRPDELEPRSVRGGSWAHDPDQLGCASRIASDPERWKRGDPQFPKSLWWNTNSPFVGFRIVRPVKQPSFEEMEQFWEETLDQFYYD